MDLASIFEPARTELEPLGFQSPKTVPMMQARPINDGCWAYIYLRGTDQFVLPLIAFTLPDLAASMFKIWPKLRMGPAPKDFDGRFMPPLLPDENNLLGESDPVWGPLESQRRGTPLGSREFRALAESMDRHVLRLKEEGWTQERVVQRVLASPSSRPHGMWGRWIAPVWFAKRGAWDEFDAFAQRLDSEHDRGLDEWRRYADKVRAYFGQAARP